MLFPLIESCFPPELLRVWQRSAGKIESQSDPNIDRASGESSLESRLRSLMLFLKNEVENEQHVSLAVEGFGFGQNSNSSKDFGKSKGLTGNTKNQFSSVPTATGLTNNINETRCVFCNTSHESANCFKAQKFSLEQKRNILTEKGACFRCLKIGHLSRKCRGRFKCIICGKSHLALMCPGTITKRVENEQSSNVISANVDANQALANSTNTQVVLQTLRIKMEGVKCCRFVRALIDTGSQKSYVLKSTAVGLGYSPKRKVNLMHGLFGGSQMLQQHDCYDIRLRHNSYSCTFEALDQHVICTVVSPVFDGPWIKELSQLGIRLSDTSDATLIEVLIGSDVAGKLYTGRRHILPCGLVAIETLLGWTLMGQIPQEESSATTMTALSLFVNNASLSDLWELETLGITDPSQQKTREERELAAKNFFLETVTVNCESRYEVRLPWIEDHPELPCNYNMAKKRLDSTVKKLRNDGYFESYDEVFREWLKEDIIEEVNEPSPSKDAHYLPHRPVIKESNATTKIRPVFDASAKEKYKPSLNQCLEKGLNLIEEIPSILLRFRTERIGVTSDIRKAFLQISIHETDRNYLRFLWVDTEGNQRIFRHRRVVFGINSSPFLLGATLEYHLDKMLHERESPYSKEVIRKLSDSFYVDNCITSVADEDARQQFIQESSLLMADGKFDLRGWEYTHQLQQELYGGTPVLGMTWDTNKDTISINIESDLPDDLLNKPVTKRLMLSLAQRVFDPIGFTCPATLLPKLLLQQTWEKSIGWDTPIDEDMASKFRSWLKELPYMASIKIPRWICAGPKEAEQWSLHTFCDASKEAFSSVVFLRGVRYDGSVFIRLLAAKSRVAPLKKLSITRLELMSAVIGARLFNSTRKNIKVNAHAFFWTDSSTVLFWIQNEEEWGTFVWNRVEEIRKTTSANSWHHVPGIINPADLPSRGCSSRKLLESKWWEGPSWLYEDISSWPKDDSILIETEIAQERKKKLVTTLISHNSEIMTTEDWHLNFFSKYSKSIRMLAWIFRFLYNSRNKNNKRQGQLISEEFDKAEEFALKLVQRETLTEDKYTHLASLDVYKDEHDVLRLRSRVSNRDDLECFRYPIVLPSKHPLISQLVFQEHVKTCHIGVQGLMSVLREHFWILGGRRAIKSVISKCVVCKKHNSKPFGANAPPLPLDRVRDAAPFEVIGVDFTGPLFLKDGGKVWICIFTCAVFRAVHLELCTSLSVASFIQALRRFIARRGRPKTIYSDNGKNFVGTENAFSRLDFNKIAEYSTVERIKWRFNPPTGSWWGGLWERLIGILKPLLRKVLGRASLNHEDLSTLICDCESIINSRPITFTSSDSNELIPLTPAMFLRDLSESGVPDLDTVDRQTLCRKMLHKQKLIEDLRKRFRSEYLGQLHLSQKRHVGREITVGEVVLIGNDQGKRLDWPMGRVTELIPGKDKRVRLVKVTTARGQYLRPIQRIFPLECIDPELADPATFGPAALEKHKPESGTTSRADSAVVPSEKSSAVSGVVKSKVPDEKVVVTRSGRQVKTPKRFSVLDYSN